jgi:hypothetical protein
MIFHAPRNVRSSARLASHTTKTYSKHVGCVHATMPCCRSIVPSEYYDPALIILAANDYNCDVGENTHKEDHHVQLLSRQGELKKNCAYFGISSPILLWLFK